MLRISRIGGLRIEKPAVFRPRPLSSVFGSPPSNCLSSPSSSSAVLAYWCSSVIVEAISRAKPGSRAEEPKIFSLSRLSRRILWTIICRPSTGDGRPGRVLAQQEELQPVEGEDVQPVIAPHPRIGQDRPLRLVRRLLRHEEQQRLLGRLQQRISDRPNTVARLARPAPTQNKLNRHASLPWRPPKCGTAALGGDPLGSPAEGGLGHRGSRTPNQNVRELVPDRQGLFNRNAVEMMTKADASGAMLTLTHAYSALGLSMSTLG